MKALWGIRHASAGPQRNEAMVEPLGLHPGLAFGGDRGTDGCIKLMKEARVTAREYDR